MINLPELERLLNKMRPLITGWTPHWIYANMPEWVANGGTANTPYTSTAWDGDSYSTASKALQDLSTVFGIPANVKAVYVWVAIRDSGSATGDPRITLDATDTANAGISIGCGGLTNDALTRATAIVPCDANGDIYTQINATGASTLDIFLRIWGYLI